MKIPSKISGNPKIDLLRWINKYLIFCISVYLKREAKFLRPIFRACACAMINFGCFFVAKWSEKPVLNWSHFRGTIKEVEIAEWYKAAERGISVFLRERGFELLA